MVTLGKGIDVALYLVMMVQRDKVNIRGDVEEGQHYTIGGRVSRILFRIGTCPIEKREREEVSQGDDKHVLRTNGRRVLVFARKRR